MTSSPPTCSTCKGEGCVRVEGSAWGKAAIAAGRPDLNYSYKFCPECKGTGNSEQRGGEAA